MLVLFKIMYSNWFNVLVTLVRKDQILRALQNSYIGCRGHFLVSRSLDQDLGPNMASCEILQVGQIEQFGPLRGDIHASMIHATPT